jgi:DNA polymerase III epsilon subunit-like protein
MSLFVVDVEADGPIPDWFSMISFGAVRVQEDLKSAPTFYATLKPISEKWNNEALAVSGFTRSETLSFPDPEKGMSAFAEWVKTYNTKGRPVFLSDNNGFDWQFINYYFHRFTGSNPFGFSSRRISDLYCGLKGDTHAKWKHLRETAHTHNPVDDAMGNAEALLKMKVLGLKMSLG